MKDITVSVIIPSYNSHQTIEHTLKHIVNQTCADKILEIIVVDSSDDTITKKLLNEFKSDKLVHITSGIRIMPAIQRNIGAKSAKGDMLCFIDSDAYPESDWVEKILEAYQKGCLVGGGSYEVPEFQRKSLIAYAQYFIEFSLFIGFGKERHEPIVASCNMFCDRELFIHEGGFPEIRASEDSLFSLKMNKIEPLVYLPQAIVFHIFRENGKHFLSNQHMLGKFIYVFRRQSYNSFYYKGIMPYLFFPAFIFFKFARIFFRVIRTGKFHNVLYFFLALPMIIKGLYAWSSGFIEGIKEYRSGQDKSTD
jgi:glycosyltransferase involved in cell wall biosynthesis